MTDNAGRQAQEQAQEYNSPFAPRTIEFDDGTKLVVPPHPQLRMFDSEDRLIAYDELLMEQETFDREEIELPQRTIRDDDGTEMVLPAETKKGQVLGPPYRKKGKIVKGHEARIVRVVLGDDKYEQLCSKTINDRPAGYSDVMRVWHDQSVEVVKRVNDDPKSAEGAGGLEALAPPDSQ